MPWGEVEEAVRREVADLVNSEYPGLRVETLLAVAVATIAD